MRALAVIVAIGNLCVLAGAQGVGVPARPGASDYSVHQDVRNAAIGAAVVPADRVGKMFSSDIAKKYVVVEVAVYPASGASFDVEPFDFRLRVGERISHTEIPAGGPVWAGNPAPPSRSPQVTTESGVYVGRETDPYGRPIHTVGTYSEVSVTNGNPAPPPPPPNSGPDPYLIDQQVRAKALGGGLTQKPVAGYLYFPQSGKRRKSDAVELQFSNDDGSVGMPFPK